MSLKSVTVTGTYVDAGGNPLSGTVQFSASAPLADSADQKSVRQGVITETLSAEGTFSVALYATDNAALTPSGWSWVVKENIFGLAPAQWSFYLPAASASFTATNASPCVFTAAGTALVNGMAVTLTGGSLPTGFTASTTYYVVAASGTSFSLAATSGGSAINSTGTGTGTVTITQVDLSDLTAITGEE